MEKQHTDYFVPLIQEFVRDIEGLLHPEIEKMPQPHFPLFGKNRIEGVTHFADKIREVFHQRRIILPFPELLSAAEQGARVIEYLQDNLPDVGGDVDKYEFVARVAEELVKRAAFMSVPALVDLVNAKGGRTNRGDHFSGGRGSYRLVSGTYHRMIGGERADRARNVAVAFKRPNFEYAYAVE